MKIVIQRYNSYLNTLYQEVCVGNSYSLVCHMSIYLVYKAR